MLSLACSLMLSGCGIAPGTASTPGSVAGGAFGGKVFGGNQPVTGSSIQLYAVGMTGYGTAATPLLHTPVSTDAYGGFSISGDYTCPSAGTLTYLTAVGGNPGLAAGTNNPAIVLFDLLGPCGNLGPNTTVDINELTTLAATYGLRPFIADYAHIGAPLSNAAGMASAFATAYQLVGIRGGSPGDAVPALATIPTTELYTLGDILSACVNTDGTVSSTTACGRLFTATTPAGGTAPATIADAALRIATSPGSNVAALFDNVTANGPYQPTMASAPADWTVAINYVSPTFRVPADLAVDAAGTVWVLSAPGTATAFGSSTVSTLTGAGITGTYPQSGLSFANLALDSAGDPWLTDSTHNGVVELTSGGTRINTAEYTGGGLTGPGPLAFDPNGNVWIVNNSATVTKLSPGGMPFQAAGYPTGGVSGPVAIAVDNTGAVWTADSAGNSVSRLSSVNGAPYAGSPYTGLGLSSPFAIGVDAAGKAYVPDRGSSQVTSINTAANPPVGLSYTGAGLNGPLALAVDGLGALWALNGNGNTLSVLSNTGAAQAGPGAIGAAFLQNPYKLAIDGSGNVWVANLGSKVVGSGIVTQFVGAAAPVVTPVALAVQKGMLGTRP